jgi:succinyl-CoA synthetase alpha subunit
MSILITKQSKILIQGITGKEGQKAARAMLDYDTQVLAGVTPKKGGQTVEGLPVFNSISEALNILPKINTTAIYVPPFAAKVAILEAIENNIGLINIITERIPISDIAYCLAAAKEKNVKIIGPSSLGLISPGIGRIGVVGGPINLANEIFTPGPVGVISRSGGMTNEVSWQIRQQGLGQSTAVHVGGDVLMGTTYGDLLKLFEQDEQTKVVVLFGEHGGSYEFEIIDLIKEKKFTKPLVVYIGGKFAGTLPEGMNIGHAGAIVEKGKGAAEKEKALAEVGVKIAENYEDLAKIASKIIK